jgi:hypothetical protein
MNSFEQNNDPSPFSIVKKASGFTLIIIGISIGLWVVTVVYDLLGDSTQIELVNVFANGMDRTIKMPAGDVELPVGLYATTGYLVVCLLLSTCVSISKSFVQFGAHLIQSDFKRLVTKLTKELKAALEKN